MCVRYWAGRPTPPSRSPSTSSCSSSRSSCLTCLDAVSDPVEMAQHTTQRTISTAAQRVGTLRPPRSILMTPPLELEFFSPNVSSSTCWSCFQSTIRSSITSLIGSHSSAICCNAGKCDPLQAAQQARLTKDYSTPAI